MNTITRFRAGYIIRRTSTFSHSIVSFHASSEKNNRPSSSLPRDPISWMPQRWPFSFPSSLCTGRPQSPFALHEKSNMKGLARIPEHYLFDYALHRELIIFENYNYSS